MAGIVVSCVLNHSSLFMHFFFIVKRIRTMALIYLISCQSVCACINCSFPLEKKNCKNVICSEHWMIDIRPSKKWICQIQKTNKFTIIHNRPTHIICWSHTNHAYIFLVLLVLSFFIYDCRTYSVTIWIY